MWSKRSPRLLEKKNVLTLGCRVDWFDFSAVESYTSFNIGQTKMSLPGKIFVGFADMAKYLNAQEWSS